MPTTTRQRIDAALALHRPMPGPGRVKFCHQCSRAFPCPTVRALAPS